MTPPLSEQKNELPFVIIHNSPPHPPKNPINAESGPGATEMRGFLGGMGVVLSSYER